MTLQEAKDALAAWEAASLAVAKSQSYSLAGRTLTRADASEIRRMIEFYEGKIVKLKRGRNGIGVRRAAV